MTETLAVIGAGLNPFADPFGVPEIPGIDGADLDTPKITAKPGGGGWVQRTPDTECFDADGNKKASKECDQEVQSGNSLVDPCWILNEYPGMTPYTEAGHQKVITGEIPLLRGPYKSIRTRMGWGWHGDGAWPSLYQGAVIELIGLDDSIACRTYGWTQEVCRAPGQAFPLSAGPCYGESIGGDSSASNSNQMATMWDRFETCMRQLFPECGEG
jgi:hypothetical protein